MPAMALARHMAALAFNFVAMMGLIGKKTGDVYEDEYDMIFKGSGKSSMMGAIPRGKAERSSSVRGERVLLRSTISCL